MKHKFRSNTGITSTRTQSKFNTIYSHIPIKQQWAYPDAKNAARTHTQTHTALLRTETSAESSSGRDPETADDQTINAGNGINLRVGRNEEACKTGKWIMASVNDWGSQLHRDGEELDQLLPSNTNFLIRSSIIVYSPRLSYYKTFSTAGLRSRLSRGEWQVKEPIVQ